MTSRTRLFPSVVLASGLVLWPLLGKAGSYDVDAASWQQPRSAAMVQALPAVRSAVNELLAADTAKLVIRHNDDEEGALWGAELRDWLVSLGIHPARMRTESSDVGTAALQLEIQP